MTPEIERWKHVGDMVNGQLVCRPDCPSQAHKVTPEPKTDEVEGWKEEVRDWWYSIQDLLAEKDICLHERKRVEIETIIKTTLQTLADKAKREREELVRELQDWNQQRVEDYHKVCLQSEFQNGHFWEAKYTQEKIKAIATKYGVNL